MHQRPPAVLTAWQHAAAGAGVIPWQLDLERLAEDVFHRLMAPPAPHRRSLSLAGARILAEQLRSAAARRHDLAVARVGRSQACPFDLHALLPVPGTLLMRGPDDPAALAWLWAQGARRRRCAMSPSWRMVDRRPGPCRRPRRCPAPRCCS